MTSGASMRIPLSPVGSFPLRPVAVRLRPQGRQWAFWRDSQAGLLLGRRRLEGDPLAGEQFMQVLLQSTEKTGLAGLLLRLKG